MVFLIILKTVVGYTVVNSVGSNVSPDLVVLSNRCDVNASLSLSSKILLSQVNAFFMVTQITLTI